MIRLDFVSIKLQLRVQDKELLNEQEIKWHTQLRRREQQLIQEYMNFRNLEIQDQEKQLYKKTPVVVRYKWFYENIGRLVGILMGVGIIVFYHCAAITVSISFKISINNNQQSYYDEKFNFTLYFILVFSLIMTNLVLHLRQLPSTSEVSKKCWISIDNTSEEETTLRRTSDDSIKRYFSNDITSY